MDQKVIAIDSAYSMERVQLPYSANPALEAGDEVIFRDDDGNEEYGIVKGVAVKGRAELPMFKQGAVLRQASENDVQRVDQAIEEAEKLAEVCKELIDTLGLEMNVFRTGLSLDGKRVHFMFTAEDRVDFRELVKRLAGRMKKLISLKQIGPRDKAMLVGGYGKCGRELCCSSWISELSSINMEMVRAQGLESKGTSKLSGSCGKLLCCLRYEVEAYKDLRKDLPRIGQQVSLEKKQRGKVIGIDILNQMLKVVLEDGEFVTVKSSAVEKIVKK